MSFNPVRPILRIKNISKYDVNIFDRVKIRPGDTKDIYSELEYDSFGSLTAKIIKELEIPEGELYSLWKVRKHIEILDFENPAFAGTGVVPDAFKTSNVYFDGAVLGIEGGELKWVGAGGVPSGPASGDLSGIYPAPKVSGLQGRGVPDIYPSTGQVLQFNGSDWVPGTIPTGGSGGGQSRWVQTTPIISVS